MRVSRGWRRLAFLLSMVLVFFLVYSAFFYDSRGLDEAREADARAKERALKLEEEKESLKRELEEERKKRRKAEAELRDEQHKRKEAEKRGGKAPQPRLKMKEIAGAKNVVPRIKPPTDKEIKQHKRQMRDRKPPRVRDSYTKPDKPIAIAFTFSGEVKWTKVALFDSVAVLAKQAHDGKYTTHPCKVVALVHKKMGDFSRDMLIKLGVDEVVEANFPLPNKDSYSDSKLRGMSGGCCGAGELLKFFAFTLVKYSYVMHIDIDVVAIRPHDELFEPDTPDFLYTEDWQMSNSASEARAPIQGGFFRIRPSMKVWDEIVAEYDRSDFVSGGGWNASGIGWCWGGGTFQGFAPYFLYNHPEISQAELDYCYYNRKQNGPGPAGECGIETELVRSVHFANQRKPWDHCWGLNALEEEEWQRWHIVYWKQFYETAQSLGIDENSVGCINGYYEPLVTRYMALKKIRAR